MNGVDYHRRGVYVRSADALVVADLHVGRDEASDVTLPLGERRDLVERLGSLVRTTSPDTVVFAGDVVHRFGTVTERARETLEELVEVCRAAGSEPVFVRGNHDTAMGSIPDEAHDSYVVATDPRTVVCHGHEAPDVDADRYVIGHDHPAITIEGKRHPCFLDAPDAYRGADVLMLPAFSRLAAGVSINDARGGDLQSPLLDDLGDARPIVYDENTGSALTFPPLSSFRQLL